MMIVLAAGMSNPDSMMVVQTSTSTRRWMKSSITFSRSRSFIWPWATLKRASGTSWLNLAAIW